MVYAGLAAVVLGLVVSVVGWCWDPDGEWALSQQEAFGILIRPEGRLSRAYLRLVRGLSVAARVLGAVLVAGGALLAVVGLLS